MAEPGIASEPVTGIVIVASLTKQFGSRLAVNQISFAIAQGEVFGLVGPNGAGKTTTVRMLATLIPPTAGSASIHGFDIRKQPTQVRRYIGYVPQALSADGDLTGYENLLIFAKLIGIPPAERSKQIEEILAVMELTDAAHTRVKQYSGGMVRRLEIGQAMLMRPSVLFLDEPTVGLDPVARGTVWELLHSFRQQYPLSILITTHYMEEAEALCDRVAIMNHGRIVALGSPGKLKAATGQPGATLEDAFRFFTGGDYEEEANYNELKRTRKIARRLG
ncbi:MAG: ATP-binding cassette domain-containing protein [Thermacetogeniaceae bacterium]